MSAILVSPARLSATPAIRIRSLPFKKAGGSSTVGCSKNSSPLRMQCSSPSTVGIRRPRAGDRCYQRGSFIAARIARPVQRRAATLVGFWPGDDQDERPGISLMGPFGINMPTCRARALTLSDGYGRKSCARRIPEHWVHCMCIPDYENRSQRGGSALVKAAVLL